MTNSEKWAIWTLGVVATAAVAWFTFIALRGSGPASQGVLALSLALTAIPKSSRRYFIKGAQFDEREKEIASKAMRVSLKALAVGLIAVAVGTTYGKGWDSTLSLPVWELGTIIWWSALLVLAVQSVATLVLYHRGSRA